MAETVSYGSIDLKLRAVSLQVYRLLYIVYYVDYSKCE